MRESCVSSSSKRSFKRRNEAPKYLPKLESQGTTPMMYEQKKLEFENDIFNATLAREGD